MKNKKVIIGIVAAIFLVGLLIGFSSGGSGNSAKDYEGIWVNIKDKSSSSDKLTVVRGADDTYLINTIQGRVNVSGKFKDGIIIGNANVNGGTYDFLYNIKDDVLIEKTAKGAVQYRKAK
ncbi:hypothetical protein NNC19_09780 [Clostridium sp. SHJSY1]|uniref:hypothetical protein n=1 Tax=Clostridium sp. SHJSY1 TaxID=2942483 RepID=UPI0028768ABC|nr:hypothetical protein [Clostridium sp. SHJSY1]MDS0525967.1 hypothetical protein [Clostridium sp. SHJSY1]